MRAVFVNHCHPDCPHVCGTRAREFAHALARQGHRIVLLTETLHRTDPALDPAVLAAALAGHDWTVPFYLAVRPRAAPVLEALRAGRLPAALRAVVVAYQYLVRGGMFTDWRDASRPFWPTLAEAFRPDVVWGIFGNTDAWSIARGIAREARCPWIRDIKDQWTAFIPAAFRELVSRRYADAAATTALSGANAADAARWFPGGAEIIYSGVPEALIAPAARRPSTIPFKLVLVGALYDAKAVGMLVDGLCRFRDAVGDEPISLVYAGTDIATAAEAFQPLALRLSIDIRGQIPFVEYCSLIAKADANLYIRTGRQGWWHHKIVELLAVRRPILCLPDEIEEAHLLARSVGGRLHGCADAADLAMTLTAIKSGDSGGEDGFGATGDAALLSLRWDSRARALLKVFAAVVPGAAE